MGRQYVIEADNPNDLPFGFKDLVLVQGLCRRDDLNSCFAEVHGRVKKGTGDLEGITMLTSGEECWIKRSSLLLIGRSFEYMKEVCEKYTIRWTEYQAGAFFLEVESERLSVIMDEYKQKMRARK